MTSSVVVETKKDKLGVLCGSAWPKWLSARHRLSPKTVWDRMSHPGRKPSTRQTSSSLTHSCAAALKHSDVRLHRLSIWITQRPVYWSQFVFPFLLWLPPPFGALSSLWSDNTNVIMQGRSTPTCRFKHTDKHKENGEERERDTQRDAYWIWTRRCRM